MFEFDDLEAVLPPEAYIVTGAGCPEVNGIYKNIGLESFGAPIFRHVEVAEQLMSREKWGERNGWLLGANRRPLYGVRTELKKCPKTGWRAFNASTPAPVVEAFSSLADASLRITEVWCREADELVKGAVYVCC